VDLDRLDRRTSSFSADDGGSCVEVARLPHLHSAAAWQAFLLAVRNGEFERR
jgi:hypothetical protein